MAAALQYVGGKLLEFIRLWENLQHVVTITWALSTGFYRLFLPQST